MLKPNYKGQDRSKQEIKKQDNQNLSQTSITLNTQL
jgi:hypothetical protein